jgi:hypothetical protein
MHAATKVHHMGKDVSSVSGKALEDLLGVKESDRSAR